MDDFWPSKIDNFWLLQNSEIFLQTHGLSLYSVFSPFQGLFRKNHLATFTYFAEVELKCHFKSRQFFVYVWTQKRFIDCCSYFLPRMSFSFPRRLRFMPSKSQSPRHPIYNLKRRDQFNESVTCYLTWIRTKILTTLNTFLGQKIMYFLNRPITSTSAKTLNHFLD